METNFAKLLKELCSLRQEMKEEIVTLKSNAKRVEKSVEELWATTRGTLGEGGFGTWYPKKKWQIPKYRVENRLNTDTAYFNHIYNRFRILMVASI